jgi:S1-C subfamily serine protease
MKKVALYSSSSPARGARRREAATAAGQGDPTERARGDPGPAALPPPRRSRWRGFVARHERPLLIVTGAVMALVFAQARFAPSSPQLTQQDIDAAVLHTLETTALPSTAAKAYEAVRHAVVRVRGLGHARDQAGLDGNPVEGVGTGVVIVDTGIILTNLHVVAGAESVQVEFDDGLEAEAAVIGMRPEHDLAVLQAKKVPDDLSAATLRSTSDLAVGDEVIAIGFPFGIGPSVSAGIVSGLRREHRSPQGKRVLTNLIQFDAAANPGNSGGPLVTADGEVVGIVTGILNPTEHRVFIGIGFAVPIENAAAAIGLSPF